MSEITVANRYAKSLIDLAKEQNLLDAVRADMSLFEQAVKANSQLGAVLRNPIIPQDKKTSVLEGIFGGKVNKITLAFFKLVVSKGRAELLYPTAQEFVNQYDVFEHIVRATVVSAAPLSADNRKQVIAEVNKIAAGEVVLTEKVNAALIGGFILTVGDKQVDTSVASSLTKLKKDFGQPVV
ncbi:ATP synthase F1 subunit delta [Mucilaginibacter agri]|uniref:ATP synthase subunit delta n=1 Tax=Mucilaginibacter agri TaxID=2695265 RepID=A0A966DTR8_9SPHI|nr:ATP synthase F1 subunit delta [Mucilaginibacter agri]NCD71558.1 ATP synthase F1 subunit delta [Mucilaginibacter agri]